jgi:2-dehydropantoate 2-reductase
MSLLIAREPTAVQIAERGVTVESVALRPLAARPAVVTCLGEPVSALLVATKETGLAAALERIEAGPELVVPLLNGLEHMELPRSHFGDTVAAGVIRIESDSPVPGRIVQTSPSLRIDLAAKEARLRPKLERLAETLRRAQLPVWIETTEARRSCGPSSPDSWRLGRRRSAADQPIGLIRSDPGWRGTLAAVVEEAAAVANADGASIDPAATLAELDEAHADLGSSMRRDIAAGREPELDAILGAVIRAGARHALSCPTIERLATAIANRAGIPAPSGAV